MRCALLKWNEHFMDSLSCSFLLNKAPISLPIFHFLSSPIPLDLHSIALHYFTGVPNGLKDYYITIEHIPLFIHTAYERIQEIDQALLRLGTDVGFPPIVL